MSVLILAALSSLSALAAGLFLGVSAGHPARLAEEHRRRAGDIGTVLLALAGCLIVAVGLVVGGR